MLASTVRHLAAMSAIPRWVTDTRGDRAAVAGSVFTTFQSSATRLVLELEQEGVERPTLGEDGLTDEERECEEDIALHARIQGISHLPAFGF